MGEVVGWEWLRWLETTRLSGALRGSAWLYPLVQTVHLVGIAVFVGAAVAFDLRLLGMAKELPIRALRRHLIGWAGLSFLLIASSGFLLFASQATALVTNRAFQIKLALLVAAGLNAAAFDRLTARTVDGWDAGAPTPAAARANACVSLLCWIGVIACGRLIAYV
jgi:hypothetical protein